MIINLINKRLNILMSTFTRFLFICFSLNVCYCAFPECTTDSALGMASGAIGDAQITCSAPDPPCTNVRPNKCESFT